MVAVADGVTNVRVGDRVLAMPWLGGYASHVEVAAGSAVPIPGDRSYGQAAALVQSYGTMLFSRANCGRPRIEAALVKNTVSCCSWSVCSISRADPKAASWR